MYKKIPTYNNGEWGYKEFETQEQLAEYLLTLFKEPGQYDFDETALLFNEQAVTFNSQGFYCNKPFRSRDYIEYWNDQKKNVEKEFYI